MQGWNNPCCKLCSTMHGIQQESMLHLLQIKLKVMVFPFQKVKSSEDMITSHSCLFPGPILPHLLPSHVARQKECSNKHGDVTHTILTSPSHVTTAFFRASTSILIGDGSSVKFWTDPWLQGNAIADLAPYLFRVVSRGRRKVCTVAEALTNNSWLRDIRGALTTQVIVDYVRIRALVERVHLQPSPDTYVWKWHPSGIYTAQSAYNALFLAEEAVAGARELWKTRAPNKCRFFLWLVMHGRCWTSERLHRHGLREDASCTFCDQVAEHLDHLFLQCAYSKEVWFKCLRRGGFVFHMPNGGESLIEWWLRAGKPHTKPRRRCFDSMVTLVVWMIWLQRNARVHKNASSLPSSLVDQVWAELQQWSRAEIQASVAERHL